MIEQALEDMYFVEIRVPNLQKEKVTVYVAAIYGTDSTYKLSRSFFQPEMDYCSDSRSYLYYLKDGVYEIGYSRYDRKTGLRQERIRYLLILLDGKRYLYTYDELGEEYVMFTAFNVWVQRAGEDTACQRFFGRGGAEHA